MYRFYLISGIAFAGLLFGKIATTNTTRHGIPVHLRNLVAARAMAFLTNPDINFLSLRRSVLTGTAGDWHLNLVRRFPKRYHSSSSQNPVKIICNAWCISMNVPKRELLTPNALTGAQRSADAGAVSGECHRKILSRRDGRVNQLWSCTYRRSPFCLIMSLLKSSLEAKTRVIAVRKTCFEAQRLLKNGNVIAKKLTDWSPCHTHDSIQKRESCTFL